MKIVTIKSYLIFITILSIAFTFPLQVLTLNPAMAILPYGFLASTFILPLFKNLYSLKINFKKKMGLSLALIFSYLVLVIFQTTWQVLLSVITPVEGISAIVIYVLPLFFFLYFRRIASIQEFRAALYAMALSGFLVGAYFVFDSYTMLVLGELNEYSIRAFDYSQFRAPEQALNEARISVNGRSHGLLESHTVSAFWIFLGCYASLTLLPIERKLSRLLIIFIYATMLLVGLNFTSIVGFILVMLLLELKYYYFFFHDFKKDVKKELQFLLYIFLISLIILIIINIFNKKFFQIIELNIISQLKLAIGNSKMGENTYFSGLLLSLVDITSENFSIFPLSPLIGTGFSSLGVKTADYGIVTTINTFGIPFFLFYFIGILALICRALKKISNSNFLASQVNGYLWFASAVIGYILFMEIHYSIWIAKSVLPIVFFSLAIYDKYLN